MEFRGELYECMCAVIKLRASAAEGVAGECDRGRSGGEARGDVGFCS